MKKTYLLLSVLLLGLTFQGFSQSLSNTDNVITLTSTCMQFGMTSGTYNLELTYFNPDDFSTHDDTFTNVTVAVSGSVMTITAPPGSFPSIATNGWWSLPDAYPGSIKLTQGSISTLMLWFQNPNGTIGFNCFALPTIFGGFDMFPNGANSIFLFWTTEMEQNSTFIEIWRSSTDSAHSFYKIGQVTAAGNSNSQIFYSIVDSTLDTQNYYYLKVLNSDGTPPVYSDTISWHCDACHFTPPAPVNCPDSIIGPDHICAFETPTTYHLSSAVPNYSTILWSVDNPASAKVSYMDDPAQVSLLRTNVPSLLTLRAIMSGCTDTITKTLYVGTPDPGISIHLLCPIRAIITDTFAPGITGNTWIIKNDSTGVTTTTHSPNASINILFHLNTWTVTGQYTNVCGTSNPVTFYGVGCGSTSGLAGQSLAAQSLATVKLSPNPTPGMVGVTVEEGTTRHPIYLIRVLDGQGVLRKTIQYPGVESVSVDLSGLTSGIYTLQIFDNKTWRSSQVVLTK